MLPAFGDVPVGAIDTQMVVRWVAELSARRAPATVRKAFGLLASSLEAAVEEGLIVRSPCRGVALPKLRRSPMRILDTGELEQLVGAVDAQYRAMVLTAAYTGLRFGELAGLHRDAADVARGVVRVEETLQEVSGEFHLGEPKSRASRRSVALPEFLCGVLDRHLADFPDPSGLVFTAPRGGPIHRVNFRRRVWLPAVDDSVGRPCRFHDLRHTHAAILIREGVHAKVIQERLGHSSITTTLDTYGHLFEGLDSAAATTLDAAYRRILADSVRTLDQSRDVSFGPGM